MTFTIPMGHRDADAPPGYLFYSRVSDSDPVFVANHLNIPIRDVLIRDGSAYIRDTHLQKVMYFRQHLQYLMENIGQPKITFPPSIAMDDPKLSVLVSAIKIGGDALRIEDMTHEFDMQMQGLAVRAMHDALLRTGGDKRETLMILITAVLETWWRLMNEVVEDK